MSQKIHPPQSQRVIRKAVFFSSSIDFLKVKIDVANPLSDALGTVSDAAGAAFPDNHLGRRIALVLLDKRIKTSTDNTDGFLRTTKTAVPHLSAATPRSSPAPIVIAIRSAVITRNPFPPVTFFLGNTDQKCCCRPIIFGDIRNHLLDRIPIDNRSYITFQNNVWIEWWQRDFTLTDAVTGTI